MKKQNGFGLQESGRFMQNIFLCGKRICSAEGWPGRSSQRPVTYGFRVSRNAGRFRQAQVRQDEEDHAVVLALCLCFTAVGAAFAETEEGFRIK